MILCHKRGWLELENIKLSELYIGDTDGSAEAQAEKFTKLFFDINGKYSELLHDTKKFLIIGDKGAGKTYLANYVCKKKTSSQFYEIQDVKKYWIVELVNKGESEDANARYLLCNWFLLQMIAKYIVEKVHPKKAKYFALSPQYKLKQFLDKEENLDIFKPWTLSTEKSEFSEVGVNGSVNSSDNTNGAMGMGSTFKSSLGQNTKIESIRKKFYECINPFESLVKKSIDKNDDIMLIFDDLDELNKTMVENPTTNDMILNLIRCVRDINFEFQQDGKKN